MAEICHRLDGIPLAIELAAARTRAMSVDQIAARLHDRFRLLGGGDRTALPRQQTLRALIDWSHDLLTAEERALFRRLAVFAGGFTLEAAEKVGADGDLDERDVLDLLTRLVEKSLVALDAGGERYRLLETVRQYAYEHLEQSGEIDAARTRHLLFYLDLAEKAGPEWIGPKQREWLTRFDHERENIIAAHAFCDRADDGGPLGLRLVRSVRFYCLNRGLLALGYGAISEALARSGALPRNLARCRVLSDAGQFATRMGRHAEALQYLTEGLAIARELGDRSRIAITLQPLGRTYLALNEMDKARVHVEEALALAREGGNKREIAAALSLSVQFRRVERDFGAAEPLCRECLALARELGDPESIMVALLNLAMVTTMRADVVHARVLLTEALRIVEDVGSRANGQALLDVAAGVAAAAGQWIVAARFYGAAENEAAHSGLQRDRADQAFLTEQVAKVRDALTAENFGTAETAGRSLTYELALAEARGWLEDRTS